MENTSRWNDNTVEGFVYRTKLDCYHSIILFGKSITIKISPIVLILSLLISSCSLSVSNSPVNDNHSEFSATINTFNNLLGTKWYSAYYYGDKVGWGKIRYRVIKNGNQPSCFMINQEYKSNLLINGYTHRMSEKTINTFSMDPPYEIITIDHFFQLDDYKKKIKLRKTADGYKIVRSSNTSNSFKVDQINYTLSKMLNLQIWLNKKPQIGETEYYYFLDLDTAKVKKREAIIEELLPTPENSFDGNHYKLSISNKNGRDGYIFLNDRAQTERMSLDGYFEFKTATKKIAKKKNPLSDLYVMNIVPIDTTLGDLNRLEKIKLKVDHKSGSLLENATGQEIIKDNETDDFYLILHSNKEKYKTTNKDEISSFSKFNKVIFNRHPDLIELMSEALAETKSVESKVRRLLSLTDEIIEDDMGILSPNLEYVLKNRKGDCSEHSLMFMALARFQNIPCRIVSGLIYMGDWGKGFAPHQWNEVVIDDKWIPVDPTREDIPMGPYYIRFPSDTGKKNELEDNLRNMRIELIDVELKTSDIE